MHSAAGEIPYEPCLDRAEEQLIRLGERTCARNVVKDPLYLCAGEIRVYNKTGLILMYSSMPSAFICSQSSAVRRHCQTMAL